LSETVTDRFYLCSACQQKKNQTVSIDEGCFFATFQSKYRLCKANPRCLIFRATPEALQKDYKKKTSLEKKNTSSFNLVFYELESKFKLDLVTEEDDKKKAN